MFGVEPVVVIVFLLCEDGMLSGQFHLNFLSLDMIKTKDFISFVHFSFPSNKFGFVTLVPLEVLQSFLLFLVGMFQSKGLSFDSSGSKFYRGFDAVKIWSLPRFGS